MPANVSGVVPDAAQFSCTSGRWNSGSEMLSTPTLPPVPSVPLLVLPIFTVCVVASSRALAPVSVGSGPASVIVATPEVSAPLGIMKMLDSTLGGSVVVRPSVCPLPDCVSVPSSPSAFALMMNCRRLP